MSSRQLIINSELEKTSFICISLVFLFLQNFFDNSFLNSWVQAGEESFSIEWDMNDQVWYEIFSFSKPANLLSSIAYPYVQLRQKFFAQQSSQALLKHVNAQQAKVLTQENSKDF